MILSALSLSKHYNLRLRLSPLYNDPFSALSLQTLQSKTKIIPTLQHYNLRLILSPLYKDPFSLVMFGERESAETIIVEWG
jgi:hypothetical protein